MGFKKENKTDGRSPGESACTQRTTITLQNDDADVKERGEIRKRTDQPPFLEMNLSRTTGLQLLNFGHFHGARLFATMFRENMCLGRHRSRYEQIQHGEALMDTDEECAGKGSNEKGKEKRKRKRTINSNRPK